MKRTALAGLATLGLGGLAPLLGAATSGPPADLQAFMEKDLNPAFTDVSYQLFHTPRAPDAEPSPGLVEALARLEKASDGLARHEGGRGSGSESFRIHAVQLQIATRGLSEAALTQDEGQTRLWLTHVSAVCASCHAEHRE